MKSILVIYVDSSLRKLVGDEEEAGMLKDLKRQLEDLGIVNKKGVFVTTNAYLQRVKELP